MFSTYQSQDVTILLKDITGLADAPGSPEREARIQSRVHYSEMLPLEYEPSPAYLAAYHDALERYAGITAEAVARAAEQIWESRGRQCALVSLARGQDAHRHSDPPAISKASTVPTSPITPSPSFGAGASTAMPWPIS